MNEYMPELAKGLEEAKWQDKVEAYKGIGEWIA